MCEISENNHLCFSEITGGPEQRILRVQQGCQGNSFHATEA